MPRRASTHRFLPAALAFAILVATPAGAAIYYVGPGGDCEASTVAAAVALAGATTAADEIRLVNTQTHNLSAGLHLTDWGPGVHGALTLSGGWSSCSDGTADLNRSTISYGGASPVIEIDTTGVNASVVTLRNLIVRDSTVRGLLIQNSSTVELYRVLVTLNDGGGIFVDADSLYVDPDSSVIDNGPAPLGGGIRCVNPITVVELGGLVASNESSGDGGGIYAEESCEVVLDSTAEVSENEALGGDGGGIYASSGALVSLFQTAVVAANRASERGGGIAASGSGTQVFLFAASILSNHAGAGGAGLYATNNAFLGTGGGSYQGAFYPTLLNLNELDAGAELGAAALVDTGATISLKQAKVFANRVQEAESQGSVFSAVEDGELRTESVAVWNSHGADRVFAVSGGGHLRVTFTTLSNNRYLHPSNGLVEALALYAIDSASDLSAFSNVFYPTGGYSVQAAVFETLDCLITSTTSGLPASTTDWIVIDPGYVNTSVGDFRLRVDSPGVDFCNTQAYTPTGGSLDGRARSHDIASNPEGSPGPAGAQSIQDIGAYELWEIFADGFETGNTSRWSDVLP